MSNINPLAPSTIAPGELFSAGTSSLQLLFAKLQLSLAQASKDKALEKMEVIKKNQDLAKKTADMIAQARDLQQKAPSAAKKVTTMPADMKSFFEANGLKWQPNVNNSNFSKDQWDYNIKSLSNFQEQIGADTQQLMVFIQDFMGQYNAYLTGANSSIREANQTLASLTRNQ